MKIVLGLALCLVAAGCGRFGGGGGGDGPLRILADGTAILSDTSEAQLIVDARGCQSVVPANGGPAEPVTDADGNQVCIDAGA